MPRWTIAFLAASFLALALTPTFRQLALVSGFVDTPGVRKVHRDPVPYLGGVALMTAVFGALVFELRLTSEALVILVLAAALGTVGLLDDHRTVDPKLRLLAELAAAAAAVTVGVKVHATGLAPLDIGITVIWIVGCTNALNLLDNMDALAGGVAAAAALNIFLLAVLGAQPVVATMAAATVGACLGFLAYNKPPAKIFMGDAGSLFLGFVVAILAVAVSPILNPPVSFVVPLLLLALPVLDTTTVSLARLRRRRPVSEGGRDHLSHRLVARGFTPKAAVATLIAAEAALGLLATLVGRRVLPLAVALVLAAAVLAVVGALAIPVRVYPQDAVGMPRRLRLAALAMVVLIPVLAAPAVSSLASSRAANRSALALARHAVELLGSSSGADPVAEFQQAAWEFARVHHQLDGPAADLGLVVPGVSSNLFAARTLADVGERLSTAGMRVAAVAQAPGVEVRGGTVGVDQLGRLESELASARRSLDDAVSRLAGLDEGFLVPVLSRAVRSASEEVARQRASVDRSLDAVHLTRVLFGADGPRRFLLGVHNSRELTGSDALLGSWAELSSDRGSLREERSGTVDDLAAAQPGPGSPPLPSSVAQRWPEFDAAKGWRQTTLSSDFPTTAEVLAALYRRSGGSAVDGVIVLDPSGLAPLLEVTGPVSVPGWPAPVGSANVVDVILAAAGTPVVGDLVEEVVHALTARPLGDPVRVATKLGTSLASGDLRIYLGQPDDEASVVRLGAAGDLPTVASADSVVVVERDASSREPLDVLRRHVGYAVTLDPSHTPALLSGHLQLALEDVGTPGSSARASATGGSTAYVSLYSPFLDDTVTGDGQPVDTVPQGSDGRLGRSAAVTVPPVGARTLEVNVEGKVRLSPEGWYRLDLLHRPWQADDGVDISIGVPDGWRIAETRGAAKVSPRVAHASPSTAGGQTVWVRIERDGLAGVWDRLFARN